MKTITAALAAHIAQPLTTMATCWRVTRVDGNQYGFTDHDRDIYFDGIRYRAATGYTATDVASNSNLDVDNLEVQGMLESPSITENDMRAGVWDHAEIKIFQVNWADTSMGGLNLRIGHIGQVTLGRNVFLAELLGLIQAYTKTVGEITSPGCRATLGDTRCGVSLTSGSPESFTQSGLVGTFTDPTIYTSSITIPTNPGVGKVTFTSGANTGLTFEVKSSVSGVSITLQLPPPYTVANGDAFTAVIKCTKDLATCRDVFHNVVNFRGEPYLQGNDKLGQVGRHT